MKYFIHIKDKNNIIKTYCCKYNNKCYLPNLKSDINLSEWEYITKEDNIIYLTKYIGGENSIIVPKVL